MYKQKSKTAHPLVVCAAIFLSLVLFTGWSNAYAQTAAERGESERSDKLTGGHIETAEFEPDQRERSIDRHFQRESARGRCSVQQQDKDDGLD